MRVHQMTATFAYGDAISNHILEIDRRLKQWGIESYIYAENIGRRAPKIGKSDSEYLRFLESSEDWLIYHYSIYTSNLKFYHQSRNRKILVYHNITPPKFFRGYDSRLELACRFGRSVLPTLRDCDWALAESQFNIDELIAAGVPAERTEVLPIFLGLDNLARAKRNNALYDKLKNNGAVNVLYVGRLVPNKACEDIIKIVRVYHQSVSPRIHLWLIGTRFLPRYNGFLEALIARWGLEDVVTFGGRVSLGDLRTYYEAADVFLYASRHEGFGVPLLESMYFDLPVLAYKTAAVPETLGSAGVMFRHFSYPGIAEMLHLLATDAALRRQIIVTQRQRLLDFSPEHVEKQLHQLFRQLGVL